MVKTDSFNVRLNKIKLLLSSFISMNSFLRLCGLFGNSEITNALKIVDFSHSLDLRLQPKVNLLSFPMGQTQHGQQILAKCDLPCHVSAYLPTVTTFKCPLTSMFL